MTRGQAILVALSGPGICFLCGVGLCFIYRDLSWWYLIHIMSLLPLFGDGRAIITALFAQMTRQGNTRQVQSLTMRYQSSMYTQVIVFL